MAFAPEIIEAIVAGKPSVEYAATFEDGLNVQIVLDAARESDRTGSVVALGRHGVSA
jgi:predicted dehydrogenase